MCAVLLTHSRAPVFSHLITVPFIVTTDNQRAHSWDAAYIDVSPFSGTEIAIGVHMKKAMTLAFKTFSKCEVLSVLEDDVEVMPDYFEAVSASYEFLTTQERSCFTCINDRGFESQGPWDPRALQHVTNSIGLGFAISRGVFGSINWGIRQWDNFLRAAGNLTCLMPEVSRCRHHASRESTHGIGYESKRLHGIKVQKTPVSGFNIFPPPASDVHAACSCDKKQCAEPYRGTYNGIVSQSKGAPCVAAPRLPEKFEMSLAWATASKGESCSSACSKGLMRCSPAGLRQPSSVFLKKFSGCDQYGAELGTELPSSVKHTSGTTICNVPWVNKATTCEASHPKTKRLCPCYRPTRFSMHLYF